jgi:hypothetical protein
MALDWMTQAAQGIQRSRGLSNVPASEEVDRIRTIIFNHCPLEEGVAYMPVPRCETCKHWELSMPDKEKGNCHVYCNAVNFDVLLTHKDFGCVQWEAK